MAERRTAINSSATHVFEVLRTVAAAEQPLGVSEISRRLQLPASTIYRALMTLEESDYIVRHQNRPRYELGPMPQLLNRALVHRFQLHGCSRPILRSLAETTGETVSLTVPVGWYGLRLAGAYGSRDIYHRYRLGEVAPLHEDLGGRGILAFLTVEEQFRYRSFVERHDLAPDPEAWRALEAHLARSRKAGLADEVISSDGRAAIALPVRNPDGEVIASLAISGPVYREQDRAAPPAALSARETLELVVAARPEDFVSPFASVAADEILIRQGGRSSDAGIAENRGKE